MAFINKLTMISCRRMFTNLHKTVIPLTKTANFHTTIRDNDKTTGIPPIIQIYHQALLTFDYKNRNYFKNNLSTLKYLVDTLKAEDLSFDRSLFNLARWTNRPPFTYIEVCQNSLINMSIFVMRPGYTMPLHDHPQMYGLVKVIAGTIHLKSFTLCRVDRGTHGQHRKLIAKLSTNKRACNHNSETCVLTPTESNFHEIQALNTPAAFFDILSPPYGTPINNVGPRCLGFYEALDIVGSDCVQLQQVNPPASFYCDHAPYLGPSIKLWDMYQPSRE